MTPNPTWEIAVRLGVAVWLLLGFARGWANGPFRFLVKPLALVCATLLVGAVAGGVGAALAARTGWPSAVCMVLAVLGLGILSYQALALLGMALFKRTRDHDPAVLRFVLGSTGALVGAAYHVLLLWLVMILVRVTGHLAADQIAVDAARGSRPGPVAPLLAGASQTLEGALGKGLLDAWDPLPRAFYGRLDQLRRLAADPGAVARLATYPGFRKIWDDPRFQALAEDPEMARAWSRGDYAAVSANPRLWALLSSPDVWATFTGPQLDAALRYALDGT